MRRIWRDNGLTIILLGMFAASLIGHWLAGWHFENEELARNGQPLVSLTDYATDPQFLATVFENWESEFLQMSTYVVLTAILFQKGSSESKNPDDPPRDADLEAQSRKPGAPAILKKGAAIRWLYAHSLGAALLILFILSFALHWTFSAREAAEEAVRNGEPALSTLRYLGSAQLWFESFQNWQSEFLSTAVLVVLSIFLRQRESPESKAVAAPNSQTGSG